MTLGLSSLTEKCNRGSWKIPLSSSWLRSFSLHKLSSHTRIIKLYIVSTHHQGPHSWIAINFHDFSTTFYLYFPIFKTYFYAICKHAARNLEWKGPEWLMILAPIIKGGPGCHPDLKKKTYMIFGALYCSCLIKIMNLVNLKVFIWKNAQLHETIQLIMF